MHPTPFRFEHLLPADESSLERGVYLVLIDPVNIPHLLVVVDGLCYSLTVNGPQPEEPLSKWIAYIRRKNAPAIFVEWKLPAGWTNEQLQLIMLKSITRHGRVVAGKVSCLFPIREAASVIYGAGFLNAGFIFELLPMLEKENALGKTIAFNLPSTFELKTYSAEELKNSIARIVSAVR